MKYEDGTEVTAQDVKYAVLRSTDKATFPNGPAYFEAMLDLPEGYEGPYKTPDMNTDSAIETPDDYTIVFHLKQPFAGFDYLAQLPQTMPVPEAKDTGAKYRNEHRDLHRALQVRGPRAGQGLRRWSATTSGTPRPTPTAPRCPTAGDVQLNVNADDIDNQRLQPVTSHVDHRRHRRAAGAR